MGTRELALEIERLRSELESQRRAFREREAELVQAQSLLRSIIANAPSPIITTDRLGRVEFVSNLPPERNDQEVIGRPAWTHVAPADQARIQAALERVIATGKPESYEATGASGRRWMVRAGPRWADEKIVGAVFIAWDVSKEKQLEAQLAISDRLASIGTLAAGVAHEINNPLTFLLGNLERLLDRLESTPEVAAVDAALEATERIRLVISDLSTYSRVSEGRRAVDVRALLDSAVRMADHQIRNRAQVERRYRDTPTVWINDGRLGQVFLNLVLNAAQAIPEGAAADHRITLETRCDPDGRVIIEVGDTGVGIPPELVEKIFEPFVTTKPRDGGTGLGLFICRSVLASLGGEISVTTQGGTIFRVTLPASAQIPPAVELDGGLRDTTEAGGPIPAQRVLVVDDEPAIASVLRSFLAEHQVTVAGSGAEGLAAIDRSDFDVVLCDLVMADVSGLELFHRLRERHPGSERKVIFMTGGAADERTRQALERLPNPVLQKPFSRRELMALIGKRR